MKFDVVVGNPPYKAGLHLDFLQQANEITKDDGSYIIVHPSEWLIQKRADPSPKRKKYAKIKSELEKTYVETRFIDNPFGASANMFVPIVITFADKLRIGCQHKDERTCRYGNLPFKPTQQFINSLDDVSQWFDGKLDKTIVQKFKAAADKNSWKNFLYKKQGDFYMALCRLLGGGRTNIVYTDGKNYCINGMYALGNGFTLEYYREIPVAKPQFGKEVGNVKPWVSFETENEFNNALSFLMKNRLFRAYVALIKIDQNACNNLTHLVPWLDWSKAWTEQELAEHIGLDELEVNNLLMIFNAITEKQ